MRKLNITAEEHRILFEKLNLPIGQGFTIEDVRKISPILETLEKNSKQINNGISFIDGEVELKNSQHAVCVTILKDTKDIKSIIEGRVIVKLLNKLEEAPLIKESENE